MVVECRCPDPGLWRGRIEARQALGLAAHHTTDWAAVEAYQRRTAAEGDFAITHPYLVVDTAMPVNTLCTQVIAWLALR